MKKNLITMIAACFIYSSIGNALDIDRLQRKKPYYEASGVKVYQQTSTNEKRGLAATASSTIKAPFEQVKQLLLNSDLDLFEKWIPNLKLITSEESSTETATQKIKTIQKGIYHTIFRMHTMIWDIDAYVQFKIEQKDIQRRGQKSSLESWFIISGVSVEKNLLPNLTRAILNQLEICLKESENPKETDIIISFDVTPGWLPPASLDRLKKGYLVQLIKAIERNTSKT